MARAEGCYTRGAAEPAPLCIVMLHCPVSRILRGAIVPYVSVRITRDGVTAEQKAQIVAEITETLRSVLGKRPEHTRVIIDEVEPDNWGFAGVLTPEYRRQQPG